MLKHCTLTSNVKAGGFASLSMEWAAGTVCDAAKRFDRANHVSDGPTPSGFAILRDGCGQLSASAAVPARLLCRYARNGAFPGCEGEIFRTNLKREG
jgi:hypothetical protein